MAQCGMRNTQMTEMDQCQCNRSRGPKNQFLEFRFFSTSLVSFKVLLWPSLRMYYDDKPLVEFIVVFRHHCVPAHIISIDVSCEQRKNRRQRNLNFVLRTIECEGRKRDDYSNSGCELCVDAGTHTLHCLMALKINWNENKTNVTVVLSVGSTALCAVCCDGFVCDGGVCASIVLFAFSARLQWAGVLRVCVASTSVEQQ